MFSPRRWFRKGSRSPLPVAALPTRFTEFRPRLELLEDRLAPATFTVNSTGDTPDANPGDGMADDGMGNTTLRAAIEEANAFAGTDIINFNIAPAGAQTIQPLSALPDLMEAVTINGTTQPGFIDTPIIELDGTSAGAANGLTITSAGSTIRGLVINRFDGDGILLDGAGVSGNLIVGNYIGTDVTGTADQGNTGAGVAFLNGTPENTIGGTNPADRNVISGNNDDGVHFSNGTGNVIQGNYIGTDVTGTVALGNNGDGVQLSQARNNTIGGSAPGAGNVISGNAGPGFIIIGGAASGNVIEGNFVGTNAAGTVARPNADGFRLAVSANRNTIRGNLISGNTGDGVRISQANTTGNVVAGNTIGLDATGAPLPNTGNGVDINGGATGNTIGGTTPADRNVISGHSGTDDAGVRITGTDTSSNVVSGNYIGTNAAGTGPVANDIGVVIEAGASGNIIGGDATAGQGNLISGNTNDGVVIEDSAGLGTTGNVVAGNTIGLDAAGAPLPNTGDGVEINGGARDNTVGGSTPADRNVISGHSGTDDAGVRLTDTGTSGNVVAGNFIGTNAAGTGPVANDIGVLIESGARGNTIGGTNSTPGMLDAGNLISGNTNDGVRITGSGTSGNVVSGNFIGTNADGTGPLANGNDGIDIIDAADNVIGGTAMGAGNVISGNTDRGVRLTGAGTTGNVLQGNLIGLDATGTADRGNGQQGVFLTNTATHNTVGGTAMGARNIISGNNTFGVELGGANTTGNLIQGNYIGTDVTGTLARGNTLDGVIIRGSANANTVRGNVISGNDQYGVNITSADNLVAGNFLGTDATGTMLLGSTQRLGVLMSSQATGNTVGGTVAGDRNVISGNSLFGIQIGPNVGTSGNVVVGNFIGTDVNGTADLGNGVDGVRITSEASDNIVGGTASGAGNLISGNNVGVRINGSGTSGNVVLGNQIGTDVNGTAVLGTSNFGVRIEVEATGNTIGGTASGAGNVISGNGTDGVRITGAGTSGNVVLGNKIGTDATGTANLGNGGSGVNILGGASSNTVGGANIIAFNDIGVNIDGAASIGNTITQNSIFDNDNLGIDLTNGGNNDQAAPVITGAFITSGTNVSFSGMLTSAPGDYVIEYFANPNGADPSGFAEGKIFLGSQPVTILGDNPFTSALFTSPIAFPDTVEFSATATRVATGDTSEFSASFDPFEVINTNDADGGSLRQAILNANAALGLNTITFAIPGMGVQTIQVGSTTSMPLPAISDPVVIDGITQPGAMCNMQPVGWNGNILIEIDFGGFTGLTVDAAGSGSTIMGLSLFHSTTAALLLDGSSNNLVTCNLIGLRAAGTDPGGVLHNANDGVQISGGGTGNTIGGSTPMARNIISANNLNGVEISGVSTSGNVVQGNYIGTDSAGTAPLGNGLGVRIFASSRNTIGGDATAGEGNLISGNSTGVFIDVGAASGNVVSGNYIGTDVAGTTDIANGTGVQIDFGAQGNTIGGDARAGEGNLISGNTNDGVLIGGNAGMGASGNVVSGNYIGTDVAGATDIANGTGVRMEFGAHGNTIGGDATAGQGNLISGNISGVVISDATDMGTSGNVVAGNYIGLDVAGTGAVPNVTGVLIDSGASGNTIGGDATAGQGNLISGNTGDGLFTGDGVFIRGTGTTGNVVAGNFIGLDATGGVLPNTKDGVDINGGATGNTVGGTTAADRNVISGHLGTISFTAGVRITGSGTSGNVVSGNYIGTDAAGTTGIANDFGVLIEMGASGNTIGGTNSTPGLLDAGNLISGNTNDFFSAGVRITGSGTSGNVVSGNYIGTNAAGTGPVANGTGVRIEDGARGNTIGGDATAGQGNLISGNTNEGVVIADTAGMGMSGNVVAGNRIGTDASGGTAVANGSFGVVVVRAADNTIGGSAAGAGNLISGNDSAGVFLTDAGTTGNVVAGNYIGLDAAGTDPLSNSDDGVVILNGASDNTIGGGNVISANGSGGVFIADPTTTGNVVAGNLIGLDATGTADRGNTDDGVLILGGARDNTVGGTTAADRNVISGNGSDGVDIQGTNTSGNVVLGNFIGTDITGLLNRGNDSDGIEVQDGATGNTIGGTTPGARNVLSGNGDAGVDFSNAGTTGNVALGNFIGTDVTGTAPLGNAAEGVVIEDGASDNTIGGTAMGARNLISGNAGEGVFILNSSGNTVLGNFIGTDVTGTLPLGNLDDGVEIAGGSTGNTIGGTTMEARNVISRNGNAGVFLTGAGTSANVVLGNFIGTDVTGTLPLGNSDEGVVIRAATDNTVGGTAMGAGNLISGNDKAGVFIFDAGTTGNLVSGNRIGTQANGTDPLPNGESGVFIGSSATANTIGGTASGSANVLSGNNYDGVFLYGSGTSGNVVLGNKIGTDLNGIAFLPNDLAGVRISGSATANTIGGTATGSANVISGNTYDGVLLTGSGTSGNVVLGNKIGTDVNGTAKLPNGSGVRIGDRATSNTIGGTASGSANVISGNGYGVFLYGSGTSGNVVLGNKIGTDTNGTAPLPNDLSGVRISGSATANTIGGTASGSANLISANQYDGVSLSGSGTSGNVVLGNLIGTDTSGSAALANGNNGVEVSNSATANTIGGTVAGAANTIAFNTGNGIQVTGSGTQGISLLGNRIFANTLLGIELGDDGVTANDNLDPDPGPNLLQNFPVLSHAENGPLGTVIEGTLNSTPGRTFRLEFFSSPSADASGFGEGQTFLGSVEVTTDGTTGDASFAPSFAVSLPAGTAITATATDLTSGDSSEFSAAQDVVIEAPTVTINQAAGQADPTNSNPILFTAVFSEAVLNFGPAGISFTGSTVGGSLMAAVIQSGPLDGTTYTVSVSGATGVGNVVASVVAGAAQDAAGNLSEASTSTDNTVAFDDVSPTVTINQAAGQTDPTNSNPILFTAVFSQAVLNFEPAGISFTGSTVGGNLMAAVTQSGPLDGTTYTVSVSGATGVGNVVASVLAGAAQDAAGNGNTASTATDNTVAFDDVSPTVTINQAAGQADPTNGQPVLFTAVFSEPVMGFTGTGISFAGSTVGGTLTAAVIESGPLDGTTYTVSVSGATGPGNVVASVLAGAAQDALGNLSEASTSTDHTVSFLGGSVSGTVYVDTNANGVPDPGEPGLASAPVFADVNGNGVPDPGEPSTRTDSQGNYRLEQLPLGSQAIVNPLPTASFVRTVPPGNALPPDLAPSSPSQGGLDFGIQPISPVLPTFPTLHPGAGNAADLNTQYVQSLYRQVLGREADPFSSFWVGMLPDPAATPAVFYQQARQVVAQGIWQSFEHRGQQINSYYQTLLGRLPDSFGGSYWFNLLFFGGVSEQEVVAGIAGSAEYQGQFASQPEYFAGLYADLLGSLTGPVPVSYNAGPLDPLAPFLAGQSSTLELARDLVFSDQSLIRGINGLGLAYLGRSLDQDVPALDLFFALYRSAGNPLLLSTTLLASHEYLTRVEQGLV